MLQENFVKISNNLQQQSLFLAGEAASGIEVLKQNAEACNSLADIVRTTLGPNGLDKMLLDPMGETIITNDGATLCKMLDIQNPAAKCLVELSQLQDKEIGDGTTSVVLVAAALLKQAAQLTSKNLHQTTIIAGYQLALKKSLQFIEKRLQVPQEELGENVLLNACQTSLSSKILGLCTEVPKIIVQACQIAKQPKNINLVHCLGGSISDSILVPGYCLMAQRVTVQMPQILKKAKIAFLDFSLQQKTFGLGMQFMIKDASKLDQAKQSEFDVSRKIINDLIAKGVNAIFATGGIDDSQNKYLVEAGVFAVRRVELEDLRRIAKATGGKVINQMLDMEGNECFDEQNAGYADEIEEKQIGADSFVFVKVGEKQINVNEQNKDNEEQPQSACTIFLRGQNSQVIDELDRAAHDAICIVCKCLASPFLVAGAGCVETSLHCYLTEYSKTINSKESIAVQAFADALLTIPKQLCLNSGLDSVELVGKMKKIHFEAIEKQCDQKKRFECNNTGLDLRNGKLVNSLQAGVLEPAISKKKSLSFACEAAVTILRIQDRIIMEKEQQQKQ